MQRVQKRFKQVMGVNEVQEYIVRGKIKLRVQNNKN